MNHSHLIKTLIESFNALADEVQSLVDRKTILEHKLRFAHEQYQYLSDKYAPAAPDVAETLAKLQLPPDVHHSILESTSFVPLPRRGQLDTRHQIALFIREGRQVAQQLASLADASKKSGSSKVDVSSPFSERGTMTSLSTVLEQDFTVEGRKGPLECPFSEINDAAGEPQGDATAVNAIDDPTPHRSTDPICATMYETMSGPPTSGHGSASKCPIRFLDQHSPEEIAEYVEKHKHQIPRSHEVCVRRYQRDQEQTKKIDAKYGNLTSMITGLGQLHQPMLPADEQHEQHEQAADTAPDTRVAKWANGVSVSDAAGPEDTGSRLLDDSSTAEERESHFDRPLKEVRVGESPSRPWGIRVPPQPAPDQPYQPDQPRRRASSPAAPVRIPSPGRSREANPAAARKCPFDHTKLGLASPAPKPGQPSAAVVEREPGVKRPPTPGQGEERPTPQAASTAMPTLPTMPTFVNPTLPDAKDDRPSSVPQMVFNITGPVFIGYPMEHALHFMQNAQQDR